MHLEPNLTKILQIMLRHLCLLKWLKLGMNVIFCQHTWLMLHFTLKLKMAGKQLPHNLMLDLAQMVWLLGRLIFLKLNLEKSLLEMCWLDSLTELENLFPKLSVLKP